MKNYANVTGLIVNEITLITTAKIVDGKTGTGDSTITLTALEGDGSGPIRHNSDRHEDSQRCDDVTFTGDLGSFAVTVDTGKIHDNCSQCDWPHDDWRGWGDFDCA